MSIAVTPELKERDARLKSMFPEYTGIIDDAVEQAVVQMRAFRAAEEHAASCRCYWCRRGRRLKVIRRQMERLPSPR